MVDKKIITKWIEKADNDLSVAMFLSGKEEYKEAVGFHSQQAVEKYLKAFVVANELKFERVHNLVKLLQYLR